VLLTDRDFSEVRGLAERERLTVAAWVRRLAASLARRPAAAKPYRLEWKTHHGRTLPGVDVTDRDRLFEQMEGRS
jgi:hypothetical protein